MNRESQRYRWLLLTATSLLFLGGFGACTDLRGLCQGEFSSFEDDFGEAVSRLEVGRRLASSGPARTLERDSREEWKQWAESKLKVTQRYIDFSEAEPRFSPIRKELGRVANSLVTFHGFAELGRGDRMARSLAQVREHVWRARELACNVEP